MSCASMLLSGRQGRMSLDGHAHLDCTAVDGGLVGCQVRGQVIALRALQHHGRGMAGEDFLITVHAGAGFSSIGCS